MKSLRHEERCCGGAHTAAEHERAVEAWDVIDARRDFFTVVDYGAPPGLVKRAASGRAPVPAAAPVSGSAGPWVSLLRVAEHLGEDNESLRKKVERAARPGALTATIAGVEFRRFNHLWKGRLPPEWR